MPPTDQNNNSDPAMIALPPTKASTPNIEPLDLIDARGETADKAGRAVLCSPRRRSGENKKQSFLHRINGIQIADTSNFLKSSKAVELSVMPYQFGCTWAKFPVVLAIIEFIGALLTYYIARLQCHVQQFWVPYISYTGNYHPEYMMFGFLLNASSFMNAGVVILTWRLMAALQPSEKRYIQNTCTVGLLSCLGLCVVANFQVQKAPYVHYMGAFAAFVFSTVYMFLASQVLQSIKEKRPDLAPDSVMRVRWVLTTMAAITFVVCFLITSIAPFLPQFDDHDNKYMENLTNPNCAHSDNEALIARENSDGVETANLALPKYASAYNIVWSLGAVFEWANCLCFLMYMGLFTFEFQQFRHVKVVLKDDERKMLDSSDSQDTESGVQFPFSKQGGENNPGSILVPIQIKKQGFKQHRRGHSYGCDALVLNIDKSQINGFTAETSTPTPSGQSLKKLRSATDVQELSSTSFDRP